MEGYFEDARQEFFTCPNYVEDMPEDVLCVHAFRVLCHVRRTMPGTFFDVRKLCERFGIGYDGKVWRRVSAQLRKLGALADVEVKDAQGRVVAKRLRFRWPEPIRAKGTDGVLGCQDTPPIRAKGTDPSVQKERIVLRLKTPAVAAAAFAAKRRRPPGKAAAVSPVPDPGEVVVSLDVVERGPELVVEPVELGERVEPAGSDVLGVQGLAPAVSRGFPEDGLRPSPLPEVLDFLASRDRPYFVRRE